MKLISTRITASEVLMRFADDEDPEKSIDVQVPISELKVPVREEWLKKLDSDFGLEDAPADEKIREVDSNTLSEIKNAAMERAQEILKESADVYRSKPADKKPMVLAVQYLKYQSKWFYIALLLIVSSCILSFSIGLNETVLTIIGLSVPLLLYQLLTYLRVRQGIFGLNAGEAGELIAFLNRNRTISGPTTPFLREDEIKNIVFEVSGRAAEVLP